MRPNPNKGNKPGMVSADAMRRIGRVVAAYERGDRDRRPKTRTVFDDGEEPRLGTISATWNKGATATVTQTKADGTTLSPAVQFQATNHFATVTVPSGTRKVLCVFVGNRWLLVAAEC